MGDFIGEAGDFGSLEGMTHVRHRRLRRRLGGCTDWDEIAGSYRHHSLADGGISVDEFRFPDGSTGCTFRSLDRAARQWSIWWVSSRDGLLQPPVRGGFEGDIGRFFGDDVHEGRPVKVRFVWHRTPGEAPRWEQAFSLDGEEWEVNWTMAFERTAV